MADQTFPYNLAQVMNTGYTLAKADNWRRTEFDDGKIAQKRISAKATYVRRVEVAVYKSNINAFIDWLESHGRNYFNFREIHSGNQTVEVRLRDEPSIEYQDTRLDGERFYTATLNLEGYRA